MSMMSMYEPTYIHAPNIRICLHDHVVGAPLLYVNMYVMYVCA